MQKLINGVWVDCTQQDLVDGDIYRIPIGGHEVDGVLVGNGWQQQVYSEPRAPLDVFTTSNESVTINGNATVGFSSVYFGINGDSANMSFDIVDGNGALQTQLDSVTLNYPPVLSLPILKFVNGSAANDEIYFATTLVAGVITIAGSFPASGNWKMLTTRINSALAEIGADWTISKDDVTFRINS